MKKHLIITLILSMMTCSPAFGNQNNEEITQDPKQINGGADVVTQNEVQHSTKEQQMKVYQSQLVKAGPVLTLGVTHQTQINGYYCGPASLSMAAKYLGYNINQQTAASYLGTTTNGTNAGAGVANALNKATNHSTSYEWIWHNYSDINTLRDRVRADIIAGYPVLLNTYESPNDNYLLGHNTGYALYHFGVIDGYNDYIDGGRYLDPAYGYFSGFVKSQTATFYDLSYAAGGRGYVW